MLLHEVIAELCTLSTQDDGIWKELLFDYDKESQNQSHSLVSLASFTPPIAVPFLWEETPGKPKKAFSRESSPILVPDSQISIVNTPPRSSISIVNTPPKSPMSIVNTNPLPVELRPLDPSKGPSPKQDSLLALQSPKPVSSASTPVKTLQSANSSKTLQSKLWSIFQIRQSEPTTAKSSAIRIPHTPPKETSLPLPQPKPEPEPEPESAPAPAPAAIPEKEQSTNDGDDFSEADDEMFELDLTSNPFKDMPYSKSEALSESSFASKFSIWRPSPTRNRDQGSAPALLANCLLTVMEMSRAVPLDDPSSKGNPTNATTTATVAESRKSHRSSQEFERFETARPSSTTMMASSWDVSGSMQSIKWGQRNLIPDDDVISPSRNIDSPCLELSIADVERNHQVEANGDIAAYDYCSSPMGSTFVFVAEHRPSATHFSEIPPRSSATHFSEITPRSSATHFVSGITPRPPSVQAISTSPTLEIATTSEQSPKSEQDGSEMQECSNASDSHDSSDKQDQDHELGFSKHYSSQGSSLDAGMETTMDEADRDRLVGNHRKHHRRTIFRMKKHPFCMSFKLNMISCCNPPEILTMNCCSKNVATSHAMNCFRA